MLKSELLEVVGFAARFRFLMTSVFKLRGRTVPWSFRNRPHALHRGKPWGFRRHKGVVRVAQLLHFVLFPGADKDDTCVVDIFCCRMDGLDGDRMVFLLP